MIYSLSSPTCKCRTLTLLPNQKECIQETLNPLGCNGGIEHFKHVCRCVIEKQLLLLLQFTGDSIKAKINLKVYEFDSTYRTLLEKTHGKRYWVFVIRERQASVYHPMKRGSCTIEDIYLPASMRDKWTTLSPNRFAMITVQSSTFIKRL